MNPTRRTLMVAGMCAMLPGAVLAKDEMQKLTVSTDWLPWGVHAGLHLAAQKGWYKQAGLDVEITDGKGSGLVMQQVAAGSIDVGQVQLSAMAAAKGQGVPLMSIACWLRLCDLAALVPVNGPIRSVKDLAGKKVGYTASSTWGPLTGPFFAAGGISVDKVKLLNVDASSLLQVYGSGRVDSVLTTLPFAKSTADKLRPSRGLLFADEGFNMPSYGLIVNLTTLAKKKDALAKFVPIEQRAWEYIYDGHVEEAVSAIVHQRPNDRLDAGILRGQINDLKPFFVTQSTKGKRFGWQSDTDWQAAINIMSKVGLIPAGKKPADFYTNQFVSA